MFITHEEIIRCALPAVIEKGRRLYDNGCVRKAGCAGSDAAGEVFDLDCLCRVTISRLDDESLSFDCSCAFAYGGACAHVAAVMLALEASQLSGSIGALPHIRELDCKPAPRLYLNEYNGTLFVEIRFAYYDGRIEVCRGDNSPYRLVPATGGEGFARIIRARAREDTLLHDLSRFKLKAYKTGVFLPAVSPREWIKEELPKCAAYGFEVYGQQHLHDYRIRESQPLVSARVSFSTGALAGHIAVSFDGVPAALGALVDAARANSRYVLLSDGTTGILPEKLLQELGSLFAVIEPDREADTINFSPGQIGSAETLLGLAG